ncbi:MAG: rcc01693 family protein [Pseudomonadota bacterium]
MDWAGLMRVGLIGLCLTPEAFWRLSPAELLFLMGKSGGSAPLNRARLDELAAAYPDAGQGE